VFEQPDKKMKILEELYAFERARELEYVWNNANVDKNPSKWEMGRPIVQAYVGVE
jgi:hypothetical protein